jgi:hypothetical protein
MRAQRNINQHGPRLSEAVIIYPLIVIMFTGIKCLWPLDRVELPEVNTGKGLKCFQP